jgi:hypothetical protein
MFKIDLLNGAALPPRSHPLLIAGGTLAFVIVGIAAAFDVVHVYAVNREIAGQQQSMATYEHQIAGLSDVAKLLASFEKHSRDVNDILKEKDLMLATHRTWSPLLATLMSSAPKGLTISEVVAKRDDKRGSAAKKGSHEYSLVMGVVSPSGAAPVETFIETLRPALPLQTGPDSIAIASQRYLQVEGQDVQYYVIECHLRQ